MLRSLALLAALTTGSSMATPHGFAVFYTRNQLGGMHALQATLTLPEQKSNKSWYACWIMLVPYIESSTAPFAQVGLIRWPGSGPRAWYFYAIRRLGEPLIFKAIGPAKGASTLARIEITRTDIALIADGQPLLQEPRNLVGGQDLRTYFQLGDEVSAYGDSISGRVSAIEGDTGNFAVPIEPDCGYSDSGISLGHADAAWQGTGRLRRGVGRFYSVPQLVPLEHCL